MEQGIVQLDEVDETTVESLFISMFGFEKSGLLQKDRFAQTPDCLLNVVDGISVEGGRWEGVDDAVTESILEGVEIMFCL